MLIFDKDYLTINLHSVIVLKKRIMEENKEDISGEFTPEITTEATVSPKARKPRVSKSTKVVEPAVEIPTTEENQEVEIIEETIFIIEEEPKKDKKKKKNKMKEKEKEKAKKAKAKEKAKAKAKKAKKAKKDKAKKAKLKAKAKEKKAKAKANKAKKNKKNKSKKK
jgi:hypothetical protein